LLLRELALWMELAAISLPTPVSPQINTGEEVRPLSILYE